MMSNVLRSLFDVRRGEVRLTLLMFAYNYLVLLTYYLLKPARDSLFLVNAGASRLPIVFIVTAVAVAAITVVYTRVSRSTRLSRLIHVTSLGLIGCLLALRALVTVDATWVYYVFYVWVSIFGALTGAQYWVFANAVFDPAQAKRLFSLLALGGILGAITGGEMTSVLVGRGVVSTENLLLVCTVLILGFVAIVYDVRRIMRSSWDRKGRKKSAAAGAGSESVAQSFKMIRKSRHLTYLVGIVALTMMTAAFVDYMFKSVSAEAFPLENDLTSFLGTFYGRLSVVSLVLQLLVTYRFLRVLGVGGVVMALPLGLLAGTIGVLVWPGLIAVVLLRGTDGAFKYSLDKTGRELLFLPVPFEVKKRTKMFIDVLVDRWFRGVAGALLLLFTAGLGFGVRELSVVVIVLLAGWIVLATLVRREYVNEFRSAIERRELDPNELTVNINDDAAMKALRSALGSGNEREIEYALSVLASYTESKAQTGDTLVEELRPLLEHPSAGIRARTVDVLRQITAGELEDVVGSLARDPSPAVRLEAMRYLLRTAPGHTHEMVGRVLAEEPPQVAVSALRCVAEWGDEKDREEINEAAVARILNADLDGAEREEVRIELARALGALADSRFVETLRCLAKDDSDRVVGATLVAMGRTRAHDFIGDLMAQLARSRFRRRASEGLAAYGNEVVPVLSYALADEAEDMGLRRSVPRVLARIPTQQSVDALITHLEIRDASLRFRVVKALNKLRARYPELVLRRDHIDRAFLEETRGYYEVLQILSVHGTEHTDAPNELLHKALSEKLTINLERIFRLLGLRYPSKDTYNAYLGIVSDERERHASALEFLDNVLGKDTKRYLLPIIDIVSQNALIEQGRALFDLRIQNREDALIQLMDGSDAWLRACAVFAAAGTDSERLRARLAACREDRDPMVAETATLALGAA